MNKPHLAIRCAACMGFALMAAVTKTASGQQAFFGFVSPLHGSAATLPPSFEALLFEIDSPSSDILSVDLYTGGNGITGRFVQRWTSSAGNGVYDITNPSGDQRNLAAADENFDSHLLTNVGTSVSLASEGLGTGAITPGVGQQLGPFPTNALSVGYAQTGVDGYLKGLITVTQPNIRTLEVAYAVEAFSDVTFMLFNADVTTTSGTTHVFAQYIPEPGSIGGIIALGISLSGRRRRERMVWK